MSENYNRMLIDQGNSTIKYCFGNEQGQLSDVKTVLDVSDIKWQPVDKIRFASVRSLQEVNELETYLLDKARDTQRVLTEATAFGVFCAYQNFQTLGIDRWLAIVAAANLTNEACAIIDFGTANTVDFLFNMQHLGGWISPGLEIMRKGVTRGTANVFVDNKYPTDLAFGLSTEECVAQGCLSNLYGLIYSAQAELDKISANGKIFLTGGNSEGLNLQQFENLEWRKKLVFEGLNRYF